MDSLTDEREIETQPTVRLTDGISLKDLMSEEGSVFQINYRDDFTAHENQEFENNETLPYNFDCLGIEDEDTYNDTEPFEQLAKKMVDLLPNGKVKKRILAEGVGNIVPGNGYITCDYNAYIEYGLTPYDSTYARNRPFKLRLGEGQTLPGIEIAIKSMKVSEKSQFLIHPDLAYGPLGCLSRVPPNVQVLFEIEIKNCLNTGSIQSYQCLGEKEQQEFSNIYEYVKGLHQKGNSFFKSNLTKQSIKEYNLAVTKLENCVLADYSEQEKQQQLLMTLYSNLVNAYMKIEAPRKACTIANQAYHLSRGTSLKVPDKVYFHNARALMALGDYKIAKQKLQVAHKRQPHNVEIGQEFAKLEQLMKINNQREEKLARSIFKNVDSKQINSLEEVTEEFKITLKQYLKDLSNDSAHMQYNLPDDLNEMELNYIKTNAPQFNVIFGDKNGKYFIYKEEIPNLD